eukprot:470721-Amphidinium_carterae.1
MHSCEQVAVVAFFLWKSWKSYQSCLAQRGGLTLASFAKMQLALRTLIVVCILQYPVSGAGTEGLDEAQETGVEATVSWPLHPNALYAFRI